MRIESSLNGEWTLVLDPDDTGKDQQWFAADSPPEGDTVSVPSVWDLWHPDYDGVGWYFHAFEAGDEWTGKRVELHFEAADYYAEVWLNGTYLGDHEGGYTPFSLDATASLQQGSNHIAVRIVDPHSEDGYGAFKTVQIPCAKEKGYFDFAGIWGDVTLVGTSPDYIADVFVQPDIRRNRIIVETEVAGEGTLHLQIEDASYEVSGEPGELILDFPDYELWSVDSPKLYTLVCRLEQDGQIVDETRVRFGMREFNVRDQRFVLNNHPIIVKAVLHQPDYARTLVAPESEELARRELQTAKDAGFNMVRLHIKTAPKITLDLCDEIGLLAYAEPPIGWIQKSDYMRERCEREVREMVLRDRNHPSIVIWGMLNESGNAGYITNGGAQTIKDDLCALTRSLDPTRLIIDDSAGINATREYSRIMRPHRTELLPFDDLHIYQRAPVDTDIDRYYRHSGDPDALVFFSEFGFGGMEDLEDVIAQYGDSKDTAKDARFLQGMLDHAQEGFKERGLDRVFGDFAGFGAAARELQCDAARFHVEALRANGKMAGYCYTQLCDAGHEFCAGVMDRWRRKKPVFETLKHVQAPLHPIIQVQQTNLAPRKTVEVSVILCNEDRLEGRADLSLQVIGPTNQVLWKKKRSIKIPKSGREIWSGTISASGTPGVHKFVVRLMQVTKRLAETSIDLHVYDTVKPSAIEIKVLDPADTWAKPCLRHAVKGSSRAPIHIVPPLANTVRAYPRDALLETLEQVRQGAVAIVFGPPDDWNDLAERVDDALTATSKDAVGAFLGMYHYVKLHPVFEGLPSPGLMRQPYRNVVPPKTFIEASDEDIAGTFDTTPIAAGNYMMEEAHWWGSDLLVKRYGAGRVVFTHMRVLENLGKDPLADRLFVNLLTHFARRAVPSDEPASLNQDALQWLRRERDDRTRLWKVIGMFPNWGDQGHNRSFPPEDKVDLDATYPGWYKAIEWRDWRTKADDDHVLNLQDALTPLYQYYPRFDYGTAYAYAEFYCQSRQDISLALRTQDATKVWLNGRLVFEWDEHLPHREFADHAVKSYVKQGRNSLLVKVSKIPGEFRFALDMTSTSPVPLQIKWWR
jgi:hypothetical protein